MPPTPEEAAAAQAAAEAEATAAAEAAEAALGEAGKKALQAERTAKRDAERRAKTAEAAQAAAEAALAAAAAESQTDSEKALAEAATAAADKATAETTAVFSRRILESEVLASAAGRLANPADAVALLNLDQFDVDATPDELRATLKTAMDALLTERPYLRADKVEGEGDGGAKPKPPTDDNITPTQRLRRAYTTPPK